MTRFRAVCAVAALAAGSSASAAAQVPGAAPARPTAAAAVISGRVTDSLSRAPVAGVTVTVVGTRLGAVTNAEGRYTIAGVPPGAFTLRAVRIGYAPQTRPVTVTAGQTLSADFTLRTQAAQLAAVVAVGYGTQSARNVTGSVGTVDTRRLETQPVPSVDQALAGQVAGVQVLQGNGVPGGGPQIQIRGLGAIGAGSQPLYVVDGFALPSSSDQVANPLTDIAPEDIASVSVLKDASAAAIYGSRASNGVVLITTKAGRSQTPTAQLNYSAGLQQPQGRNRPAMMNAQEFAQFQRERIEDHIRIDLRREPTAADIPADYQNPQAYGAGTDWYDAITRNAPLQQLSISTTGGSQALATYLSAGYFSQPGLVRGTQFDRYTARANVNANISPRLRVGGTVAPTFSRRRLTVVGGSGRSEAGGLAQAAIASPLVPIYDSTGAFVPQIGSAQMLSVPNPVLALAQIEDRTRDFRGIGTGFAEFTVVDGLRLRTSANVDVRNSRFEGFVPSTIGSTNSPPPHTPYSTYSASNYVNWLAENTINYTRQFGGRQSIDLLGGVSVQQQNSDGGTFYGDNYADDDVRTLNAAPLITGGSDVQDWGLVSYYTRANYSYGDKYLLTAAIRTDGSSRFAPGHRWGAFPSASLGWRLSEEPFIPRPAWLNDAKLRVSFGRTGNLNIGNFDYVGQVANSNYILGNSLGSGRRLATLGNTDLGWEKTQEVDLGLDLAFLNNRVTFTVDTYRRDTKDLLLNVEVPQSSGFGNVTRNTGSVRNRGFEFALRTNNIERPTLRWSTDVNVALNRNRVLALGSTGSPIRAGSTGSGSPTNITQIGQPVGMLYGYVSQGLYRDSAEIANGPNYAGAIPGTVKYKDINGDGTITAISDFAIIGNPYPDATFGINNTITAGKFGLSILAAGQLGGQRLEAFQEYLHNIDGVFNVASDIRNRYRSPEQPGDGKTPTTAGGSRGRVLYRDTNSGWVHGASYLSVRNVALSYRLPPRLFGRSSNNANVFFSIQNALLVTSYPGNPEVTNYTAGGVLTPAVDFTPYPVPRTFTLGTQLAF